MTRPDESGDLQALRRYLLDQASPEEQGEIEERYLRNDAAVEALRRVEAELIDDYHCGSLTPETRARFEALYLASPARRERVIFGGTLLARAARGRSRATVAPGLHAVAWRRVAAWSGLAAAAALAVVVWRPEPGVGSPPPRASPTPTATLPDAATFQLAPGRVRSAASAVTVPADAPRVVLELEVAGPGIDYDVTLQSAEGRVVWTGRGLPGRPAAEGWAVRVDVAGPLAPGDYMFLLRPSGGSPGDPRAAEYFFRAADLGPVGGPRRH